MNKKRYKKLRNTLFWKFDRDHCGIDEELGIGWDRQPYHEELSKDFGVPIKTIKSFYDMWEKAGGLDRLFKETDK